jgi:Uma2 family endonuclease
MNIKIEAMPLAEFIRRYDDAAFEWIDGEMRPVSPSVAGPNVIAKRLFRALLPFEEAGLGEVFTEAPFVLTDIPNWVKGSRVPDVMFYRSVRLAAYRENMPDWEDKPFVLVPDLVIEVLSPTDSYSDVTEKITRYLDDGVLLVWVVDAKPRTVVVHVPGSPPQTLHEGDTLKGGEVVPGFEMVVGRLFG